MPTIASTTSSRPIAFSVAPLAQGRAAADLQRALAFLQFKIAEREVKDQRFGRSSVAALRAFQAQHSLPATGRLDDATSDRLNEALTSRGFFPPKRRPFPDPQSLRLKPRDEDRFEAEGRDFVHQRLNQQLKELMLGALRRPSEALKTAVHEMDLNYTEVTGEPIQAVFMDRVLPVLLDRPELEEEIEGHADQGVSLGDETVAERLMLDQDLRGHPLFTEETRRSRNAALGAIARLDARQTEAIEDLDLDSAGTQTWDRLVSENTLTARQRDALKNAVEFAKLTDDSFELIEALHADRKVDPRDLITMDKSDWLTLLTRQNILPPEGDTVDAYAELLDLNVDQTFRTPYLMHRLVERKQDDVLSRVTDLEPIGARNERIFVDGRVSETLDLTGVDENQRPRLEASLRELNRFANTYRYFDIAAILNDRNLNTADKLRAIRGKQQLLQSFHRNNPDLDLEWANFFDAVTPSGHAFQPKWTGISDDDRPQVRRTMMALQRAQRLTDNFSETEALLAAGLDSGIAIVALSEAELARRTNLSKATVQRVSRKAGEQAILTGHALTIVEESTTHLPFLPAVLKEVSGGPNLDIINVLKDIDGYEDLFGDQNYCRCKHCRSLFGPAAYFVDLMDFIDQHVSRPIFVEHARTAHPLYLRNRRSDLWTLVLSCKNTDSRVPYLNIVNTALERYLERAFEEDDIYEALIEARLSFHQPFNLPFQALLLHLGYFQIPLSDLYELFALSTTDVVRARLGAAPEEMATIVSPNISDVLVRYDVPLAARPLRVASIVKRSGFSREELGRLLRLDFIRGGLLLELKSESLTGDLIGFDETLSIRTGANGQVLPSDNAFVRHFLDRLHRYRRLGRRLPWSPEELHLVLTSIIDTDLFAGVSAGNTVARTAALGRALDEALVIDIANLRLIQQTLGTSVEELFALYHEIPRSVIDPDKASLFVRLFGEVDSLRIHHPILGNADPDNAVVSPDFGLLQGALRLSEAQVVELISIVLTPQAIESAILDHAQLSALYRHAALARFLRFGPAALARVQDLFELPRTVERPAQRIPHILALLDFKKALDQTPFAVNDVLWLVEGQVFDGSRPQVDEAQVQALLERMRKDPMLFLTPESLVQIEAVSFEQAQALIAIMARAPLNWLARSDEVQERYTVTSTYSLDPNLEPVVAFFSDAGDSSELAARKADGVRQQLDSHHPHTIFIGHLTEQFNINREYFGAVRPFLATNLADDAFINLLFSWLAPADETDTQVLLDLLQALEQRLYLVQEKLDLSVQSLNFIATNPQFFAIALPFDVDWQSLRLLASYKAFLPTKPEDVAELHRALMSFAGQAFPEESWVLLVKVLKADLGQISSLLDNLVFPASPLDALVLLEQALKLTSKLGLNGAALRQLTATDYAGLKVANGLVEGAIRAKYDQETEWAEVIEPYVDKLNETKRDALVDRILSKAFQLKFNDARELYQFFLLDVEMDGCARTSRVLEAISACQLYVHRCRMNLEQEESGDVHVLPDSIPGDEWLWRKNYRVWEANRKVFLYPENWLEPDLRDNKTPPFRQVESELLQREISLESVDAIYKNYVRDFSVLAKLKVVSALYDDRVEGQETYWFFARTCDNPYQYYFRRLINKSAWTAWEKIDLTIAAPTVSAVLHQGRLCLFWVSLIGSDDAMGLVNLSEGDSAEGNRSRGQPVSLEYVSLTQSGKWNEAQSLSFYLFESADGMRPFMPFSSKVYPESKGQVRIIHPISLDGAFHQVVGFVDEFDNRVRDKEGGPVNPWKVGQLFANVEYRSSGLRMWFGPGFFPAFKELGIKAGTVALFNSEASADEDLSMTLRDDSNVALVRFPNIPKIELRIVHNRLQDNLLQYEDQQFFIYRTEMPGYSDKTPDSLLELVIAIANSKRRMARLTTTVADRLGEVLFNHGIEAFLQLKTQQTTEIPLPGADVVFSWLGELVPPSDGELLLAPVTQLNFNGAYGTYFRELFFDIPLLIAHYLNANQKFEQADHWYRKVFDPTASENPEPPNWTDRNWRYIEFRNQKVPKLQQVLTDAAAIEQYKRDPFNPWAIARFRISAFQKAVVMKYVDNLLDWGDYLFAQDTAESINEATMLYIMAADILGERPLELGDCETVSESLLTYQNILSHQRSGSEFLIELENLYATLVYMNFEALPPPDDDDDISAGFVALRAKNTELKPYAVAKSTLRQASPAPAVLPAQFKIAAKLGADTAVHRSLAFCVPPNETLLGYWDRVDDRLFKIRNCMNLGGVRRELALFQSPIDPGLLVRAKAAGLSLEDVLGLLTAEVPAYRFAYLLGKAQQFTGTVQNFGNALLSVMEKKDSEELALLRALHEQELLKAVRDVKVENKNEADANKKSLEEAQELARTRKLYYQDLLDNAQDVEFAMNTYEMTQLEKLEEGKGKQESAVQAELDASVHYKAPTWEAAGQAGGGWNWSVGGGVATLIASVSYGSANLAALKASDANKRRKEALGLEFEGNQASIKGGYVRRKAEWSHQKALAEQEEIHQLEQQILAATIRIDLAEKDLAAHDKQIEQSIEVDAFCKDKFTNLGLYTHLATSLSRLYREAYNLTHDLAMKAQRAYQYETDDQTFFVAADNWQADKAGLLAGERLALQLQRMDKAYLEQSRREYEITLPCSIAQIDPRALIDLRETGRCDFSVSEIWFDLYYPGQYKRRIKSVRLTIPCVTGPYTNVSAKLTLTGSRMRRAPQLNSEPVGIAHQRNTSVAASSANSDAGVFELNFRDERYVPFEGAGADSDWHLELPSVFRPFNYDTISDVILHISYVAKDDGRFREDVEADLADRFERLAAEAGLVRWFSMKREFGAALHRLLRPSPGSTPTAELTLDQRYFPHFLRNREITLDQATLILKPVEGEVLDVDELDLRLNDSEGAGWLPFPAPEGQLRAKTFALGELLNAAGNRWAITVSDGELSQVDDIWIMVVYSI